MVSGIRRKTKNFSVCKQRFLPCLFSLLYIVLDCICSFDINDASAKDFLYGSRLKWGSTPLAKNARGIYILHAKEGPGVEGYSVLSNHLLVFSSCCLFAYVIIVLRGTIVTGQTALTFVQPDVDEIDQHLLGHVCPAATRTFLGTMATTSF